TQHSMRDVALRAEKIATAAGVQAAIEQQAAAQKAAAAKAQQAAAAKVAAARAAARAAAAKAAQQKQQLTAAENSGTPQQIAAAMLSQFGWSSGQMSC